MTNPTRESLEALAGNVRKLRVDLVPCPICGAQPRRNGRGRTGGVLCAFADHRIQIYGGTSAEADRIWNEHCSGWARLNDPGAQLKAAFSVIEKVAALDHAAVAMDDGFGLNSRAASLRGALRVIRAHLQENPND